MSFSSVLKQMLYPQNCKCVLCGKEIFGNRYGLCNGCSLTANVRFCRKCGRNIGETSEYCDDCKRDIRYFTCARSPFVFEGKAKKIVYKLKYGGGKFLAKYIAQFLADEFYKQNWYVDVITFVPMHAKREKSRGYNQAELIASHLSGIIGVPVAELLTRIKYSDNFARMSRKERQKEANESFLCDIKLRGESVLLVDDVFTTGSTTSACAKQLIDKGAREVFVLTFCTAEIKNVLY